MDDKKIAPVFTGIIKIDWSSQLPIVCDFWENLIWGGEKYQKNLMQKHLNFNKKIHLTPSHLEKRLLHWNTLLTENFSGKNSELVKERATIIGRLIIFKLVNNYPRLQKSLKELARLPSYKRQWVIRDKCKFNLLTWIRNY